jgi:nucleoid-associated protein YgaU
VRTDSVPPPVPTPMPMNQNLPPITNSNNNNNNSNPFAKAETPLPVIPAPMNQNLPPITNSNNNNNNNSGFVIPAPGKTSEVKVTNYDTQSFVARPGDSFASLSKAAYESEAYGNALLAFNRDYNRDFHPNATALQPGQKVMLPSRQFLQDRYSAALANNRPGMTQNGGITINAPVPVIPKSNVPVPPTSDVTKSYRVPGAGQPIYELAIQTLGDGGRWTEIYRLNPNLDPLQPIPGGTVVRLPVNARAP